MSLFNFTRKKKSTAPESELLKLNTALAEQDRQLAVIRDAEDRYERDKNIDALISFWEQIWNQGGLLFQGSKWTFRLPDLYIKKKRYDDALKILEKIKNPSYQDKKRSYIERVKALRSKTK